MARRRRARGGPCARCVAQRDAALLGLAGRGVARRSLALRVAAKRFAPRGSRRCAALLGGPGGSRRSLVGLADRGKARAEKGDQGPRESKRVAAKREPRKETRGRESQNGDVGSSPGPLTQRALRGEPQRSASPRPAPRRSHGTPDEVLRHGHPKSRGSAATQNRRRAATQNLEANKATQRPPKISPSNSTSVP